MTPEDHQSLSAIFALLLWPLFTFIIFSRARSIGSGLIWSFILAQLFLPVGAVIKFPMVPGIDKSSVTGLSALAACFVFSSSRFANEGSKLGIVEIFLVMNIFGPVISSQFNGDNIIIGGRYLPGVGLYDAISAMEAACIDLIPFFLGRKFLGSSQDLPVIHRALALSGALYSILLLLEIRLSPQLHFWVYGYYPTEFVQAVRDGGFRPMAFMGHGLLAAFFQMVCLIAATTLWRARVPAPQPVRWSALSIYLGFVLLACKSLGALIYGIFGSALLLFARPKTVVAASCCLAAISLGYPILRVSGLMPTEKIVALSSLASSERAGSLQFRLDNEDRLLEHAFKRPFFGWGRFGRSRVYDPETGKDISVTDGRWIIDLGQFGFVGFFGEFGLLCLCVFRSVRSLRSSQSSQIQLYIAGLVLILSFNIVDLLPNASLMPLTWLFAGSLLGQSDRTSKGGRAMISRARAASAGGGGVRLTQHSKSGVFLARWSRTGTLLSAFISATLSKQALALFNQSPVQR